MYLFFSGPNTDKITINKETTTETTINNEEQEPNTLLIIAVALPSFVALILLIAIFIFIWRVRVHLNARKGVQTSVLPTTTPKQRHDSWSPQIYENVSRYWTKN